MNHWGVIYRLMWGVLAVLVAIGLVCVFVPKWRHIRELQRRRTALKAENDRTREMTGELMSKQDRFRSDPTFVERMARETGMIKEEETVFRFANESGNSSNRTDP